LSCGEGDFCSSEIKHDRKTIRPKVVCFDGKITGRKDASEKKLLWVLVPVVMYFVARKLRTVDDWRHDKIVFFFGEEIIGMNFRNPKAVLGSSPRKVFSVGCIGN
jgi:hypothetical protein